MGLVRRSKEKETLLMRYVFVLFLVACGSNTTETVDMDSQDLTWTSDIALVYLSNANSSNGLDKCSLADCQAPFNRKSWYSDPAKEQ